MSCSSCRLYLFLEWDKVTLAYLCLLKLLPPTAKGKKKAQREGIHSVVDRLILFHKVSKLACNPNAPIVKEILTYPVIK